MTITISFQFESLDWTRVVDGHILPSNTLLLNGHFNNYNQIFFITADYFMTSPWIHYIAERIQCRINSVTTLINNFIGGKILHIKFCTMKYLSLCSKEIIKKHYFIYSLNDFLSYCHHPFGNVTTTIYKLYIILVSTRNVSKVE